MISWHRNLSNLGRAECYRRGFELAHVDDVERIAKAITRYPWSSISWKDGICLHGNFLGAQFCVLDFDDGALALEQAKRLWCDAVHIIGTTKSHQVAKNGAAPCDRFRVVLRFEKTIHNVSTYRATMARYIDKYGADSACKDGARFFWPCKEIVSIQAEGYSQEVVEPEPHEVMTAGKSSSEWNAIVQAGKQAGARNMSLARIAGHLARRGVDVHVAAALLEAYNAARVSPPQSSTDFQKTFLSIFRKENARRRARRPSA